MIPNVTTSTATPSRMMVKLDDVKTELGITGTGSDAQLTRMIISASRLAALMGLGRPPWLETVVERRAGRGGSYLKLSRWPILSLTSITEGTGSSPTTVTASTYSIAGNLRRDRVYRVDGWSWHSQAGPHSYFDVDGPELGYNVTYEAGWVMPDQITAWAAATGVVANEWYSAADDSPGGQSDNPFIFRAGGVGTTDAAEPTWPTAIAGTVTDNDITWTAYDQRIPEDVEEIMLHQVISWFQGSVVGAPSNIRRERDGPTEIEYFGSNEKVVPSALLPEAKAVLRGYR